MAAKVDYKYEESWQRGKETWAEVRIDTKKGSFSRFVSSPLGTPENPADEAAFTAKFDSCAAKAACPGTPEQLDALKNVIRNLDALGDVRGFSALL